MRFDVITIVWGARHTQLFLDLTLPNVLSEGNLPKLAREHQVVYRFFTTPETRDHIAASPAGRRLAKTCEVEFMTPLGERTPDVSWHVHWFHRSAAEGKIRGSCVVFVPPDTLWTDGALSRIGALIASGKAGVACPFVLVSSETCVPDARSRYFDADANVLTVPANEFWSLAGRHVHPLHALAVPGAPHARPAFEMHFPVAGAGMISRYAVRELTAFDPARCPISFLWYAAGPQDADQIHFVTRSDEMLMLSVDPLSKYFQNYIVDHSVHGFDLARTTRHPLNDTPFTRAFASRSVEICDKPDRPQVWRRVEMKAAAAGRDILVGRLAMLVYEHLTAAGADIMAGLLSVGLLDTHFARRWREDVPLSVIVPLDRAFSRLQRQAAMKCADAESSRELVHLLRDHVIAGLLGPTEGTVTLSGSPIEIVKKGEALTVNGAKVVAGPFELEGIRLYLVDGVVSPALLSSARKMPTAVEAGTGALRELAQKLFGRLSSR